MLLFALVMVNVPVYLLLGRQLFGTWGRFVESVRVWLSMEMFSGPGGAASEEVAADVRLGVLLAGSAAVVLIEFFVLAEYVLHLPA
jgi:hypothetical protein